MAINTCIAEWKLIDQNTALLVRRTIFAKDLKFVKTRKLIQGLKLLDIEELLRVSKYPWRIEKCISYEPGRILESNDFRPLEWGNIDPDKFLEYASTHIANKYISVYSTSDECNQSVLDIHRVYVNIMKLNKHYRSCRHTLWYVLDWYGKSNKERE